jgi:hypothetical protein
MCRRSGHNPSRFLAGPGGRFQNRRTPRSRPRLTKMRWEVARARAYGQQLVPEPLTWVGRSAALRQPDRSHEPVRQPDVLTDQSHAGIHTFFSLLDDVSLARFVYIKGNSIANQRLINMDPTAIPCYKLVLAGGKL